VTAFRGCKTKNYTEFTFTGSLRDGRFTDHGSVLFPGGEQYNGNFAVGRFDGEGTLYCETNNWNFSGVFREGQFSGGSFHIDGGEPVAYERGDTWRYEGGLNEHGQNGMGAFTFPNGAVYSGGFSQGFAEGEGTYTDASGRIVYIGGFKGGRFDGQGRYFSPDAWSYEGGFSNGLFHGEGVIVTDTDAIRGVWEKGVQITRYE